MLSLTTNDLYRKDLITFLTDNMDDGWGTSFKNMEQSAKEVIIKEFENLAEQNFKDELPQTIKGKYLKVGAETDSFYLTSEYFNLEMGIDNKTLTTPLSSIQWDTIQ